MSGLHTLLRGVRGLRHGLSLVASLMNAVAGWSYVGVAVFVTIDVVTRQVFGFSSGSTTEIAGYVLACGITWGLARAMLDRAHIRIDILVMRIPLGLRQYLHAIALALLLVFIGFMASSGLGLAEESASFGSTDLSALGTPLAIPQFIWTWGLGFFSLVLVVMLVEVVILLLLGDAAAVNTLLAHHEAEALVDRPPEPLP